LANFAPLLAACPAYRRLSARVTSVEPPPNKAVAESFTHHNAAFADLSDTQRTDLFDAARLMLDVAVEYIRGTLNDHTVTTAIMVYRQAISTEPITARNPAEFNAIMDAPILQFLVDRARRQAAATSNVTVDIGGDHE